MGAVRDYNSFAANYNAKVRGQLDQIEKEFRDQMSMQGDCLRKLIVAEVSMFKNIEYDLLNISKQMEGLDTQKDVEVFNEEQRENVNNRVVPDTREEKEESRKVRRRRSSQGSMEALVADELEKKKVLGKSMLNESLLNVDEDYFSWMLHNKKNKKLLDIVNIAWEQFNKGEEKEKSIEENGGEKKEETEEEVLKEEEK